MRFPRAESSTRYPLAVALLLPLLMLAANGQWIYDSTHFFDTNVYLGFFRHYLEFKTPFTANYKSSRLPFILPGVLAYRLLPAVAAHHALFLIPHGIKTALLFAIVRRRYGVAVGFVVATADAVFTAPDSLSSYHNEVASTYFIGALGAILLPTSWRLEVRALLAGFLLATALTTNTMVLVVAPLVGLYLVEAMPRPYRVRRIAVLAGLTVAGGVTALIFFGLLNRLLGGPFLFFIDQLRQSALYARIQVLSTARWRDFVLEIWRFPWLILPFVVTGGCLVRLGKLLVRRVRERSWPTDAAPWAVDAVGVVGCAIAAVWMQKRGLGALEQPFLLHPYFVSVFLGIPVLLGADTRSRDLPLGWRDLAVVALIAVGPLTLLGAPLARVVVRAGAAWPPATFGVPFAAAGLLIAAVVVALGRRHPRAVVFAGALGLTAANAFCVTPWQPAYLYQLGDKCTFRSDAFAAIMAADEALTPFDPENEARWASSAAPAEYPQFDGQGWCNALPMQTVARAALLTRYFYTTDEFIYGEKARPLKKVILAGASPAEIDTLEAAAKTGLPPGGRMDPVFDKKIVRGIVSLYLKGYAIVLAK